MRKTPNIIFDDYDELEEEFSKPVQGIFTARNERHKFQISHLYMNQEIIDAMDSLLDIYIGFRPTDIIRIALIRLAEEEESRIISKVKFNPSLLEKIKNLIKEDGQDIHQTQST